MSLDETPTPDTPPWGIFAAIGVWVASVLFILVIPTFFGVTLLAFSLIHLIPGDPVETMSGERGMDPARYQRLLHAIRGFELRIESLCGKYKLSQNRTPADQRGVIARLSASRDQSAREVGELMAQASRVPGGHSAA